MARVVEAFYKVQKDRLHPRPYQVHDDSSEEDTFVLFSALQDIANE